LQSTKELLLSNTGRELLETLICMRTLLLEMTRKNIVERSIHAIPEKFREIVVSVVPRNYFQKTSNSKKFEEILLYNYSIKKTTFKM
jgi:hypothetical protein